ncbi:uncharacterized protein VTP21DRAFT_3954 [Calcarisporiella thermophila]|uniref:uncharacterized protein n=1 Tax=Calcarisporiella thermophila TaxID=911321 RepID=UPI0037435E44
MRILSLVYPCALILLPLLFALAVDSASYDGSAIGSPAIARPLRWARRSIGGDEKAKPSKTSPAQVAQPLTPTEREKAPKSTPTKAEDAIPAETRPSKQVVPSEQAESPASADRSATKRKDPEPTASDEPVPSPRIMDIPGNKTSRSGEEIKDSQMPSSNLTILMATTHSPDQGNSTLPTKKPGKNIQLNIYDGGETPPSEGACSQSSPYDPTSSASGICGVASRFAEPTGTNPSGESDKSINKPTSKTDGSASPPTRSHTTPTPTTTTTTTTSPAAAAEEEAHPRKEEKHSASPLTAHPTEPATPFCKVYDCVGPMETVLLVPTAPVPTLPISPPKFVLRPGEGIAASVSSPNLAIPRTLLLALSLLLVNLPHL